MEIKGYRLVKGPLLISFFDADRVLEYISGMEVEDLLVIKPLDEEYFKLLCFWREDGEQLNLDLENEAI